MQQSLEQYLANRPKGSTLRAARRQMAAGSASKRELGAMHTRVFPLVDPLAEAVWDLARPAAAALRGFGPNSLFDVLMTAHSHGFRLFPSGAERAAFGLRDQAASRDFDAAAAAAFPDCKSFTVAALRTVLSAAPRKVGKDTDAGVLAERLARAVGAPKAAGLVQLPRGVAAAAEAMAAAFPTWLALVADPVAAAEHLDSAWRAEGVALPSLAAALSGPAQVLPEGVGEVSVRFDPAAAWIDETDPSGRFAGVIARYLPEAGGLSSPTVSKALQALVTTPSGNAMSWLFGVGRRVLRDQPAEVIAAALDAQSDAGRRAAAALTRVVQSLPVLDGLGEGVYRDARATVQGTVDSLIANYLNRLVALAAGVAAGREHRLEPPACLMDAAPDGLYDGLPFTADDIAARYAEHPMQAEQVAAALAVLSGQAPADAGGYAAALDQVEAYRQWLEALAGMLNTLMARLRPRDDEGPAPFTLPPWLDGIDRPVRIAVPTEPPEELYPRLMVEFSTLRESRDAALQALVANYGITSERLWTAAMERVRDDEAMAEARGVAVATSPQTYRQRAARYLLDVLFRAARRCSPTMWSEAVGVAQTHGLTRTVWSERAIKAYFHGGQSQVYLPPGSRRVSQIPLEGVALDGLDIAAFAQDLIAIARRKKLLRDQVQLESAWWHCQLLGLPPRVDAAVLPEAPATGRGYRLTPAADGTVPRGEAIKFINACYTTPLSGLLYRLNRSAFVEKLTLSCWVGTTLLFVPKDTVWTPPAQYEVGKFAPYFADAVRDDAGRVQVKPTTKAWARRANGLDENERKVLLGLIRQLPHDWVVCCDFAGAESHEGIMVSDGALEKAWVRRAGYRVSIPRTFEREVGEAFIDRSLSPHSLILERDWHWDGQTVVETGRRVSAAVPIATPTRPAEPWAPKALMGIDLGEAGLGITIKPLDGGPEIAAFHPLKRLRKLARSVEHYRRRQQPRQSYRASFSDSLAYAAEAAVGEICGVIDALMLRFRAVPVFESNAPRAKGSTPMIPKVFEQVMAHYCYLSSPVTAEAVRTTHWYGAPRFEVPGWMELRPEVRRLPAAERAAIKPQAAYRPWLVFPGTMISGFGTSITCSCCGFNPFDLVVAAADAGQELFATDEAGIGTLTVGGREQRLALAAPVKSPAVAKAARQRKRRVPYGPLANATWSMTSKTRRAELLKALRISMRRARPEIQSRRGHGAVFVCPRVECGAVLDADINASTVLVRRYHARLLSEQPTP